MLMLSHGSGDAILRLAKALHVRNVTVCLFQAINFCQDVPRAKKCSTTNIHECRHRAGCFQASESLWSLAGLVRYAQECAAYIILVHGTTTNSCMRFDA